MNDLISAKSSAEMRIKYGRIYGTNNDQGAHTD